MIIDSNKQKNLSYLFDKRIAVIQKSKYPLQEQIQSYNNNLIDKLVIGDYDDLSIFDETIILAILLKINKPQTWNDYQKVINSNLTSDSQTYKVLSKYNANKINEVVSKAETERVIKNITFVNNALKNANFDIDKYKQFIQKTPPSTSRYEILKRTLIEGEIPTSRQLAYRQLDNLSKALEKYKSNAIDYQKALDENTEAIDKGRGLIHTHKVWIWSRLPNTRHSSNSGQTVPINSPFAVVNDKYKFVDHLMFPCDIPNDKSGTNTPNCGCWFFTTRI